MRSWTLRKQLVVIGLLLTTIPLFALAAVVHWKSQEMVHTAEKLGTSATEADLQRFLVAMHAVTASHDQLWRKEVQTFLGVAQGVADRYGPLAPRGLPINWEARNQFTGEQVKVSLAAVSVGRTWLNTTVDAGRPAPLVDELRGMTGLNCTIFQRMNPAGDMLRISTNVLTPDGHRAAGTFVPAKNADGTANAVVSTVLRGEDYIGLAQVLDRQFTSAYRPWRGPDQQVAGMIWVGVPESRTTGEVLALLRKAKFGTSGRTFVLHTKGQQRGKFVLSAGDLTGQQQVIDEICTKAEQLDDRSLGEVRYTIGNSTHQAASGKLTKFIYYRPWDWAIGVELDTAEMTSIRDRLQAIFGQGGQAVLGTVVIALLLAGVVWLWLSRRLNQQLASFAAKLRRTVQQVSASTRTWQQAGASLSQGASCQASAIEQTAASSTEIRAMSEQNLESAQRAANVMSKVDESVRQAQVDLQQLSTGMRDLQLANRKVAGTLKLIEEISFQTNLLSLNAAVEAARAGQAGVGFAVVADEVRMLAQRCAKASQEIASIVQDSIGSAAESSSRVDLVTQVFQAIFISTEEVRRLVEQVREGSQEQTRGVVDISTALAKMEALTHETGSAIHASKEAGVQVQGETKALRSVTAQLQAMIAG